MRDKNRLFGFYVELAEIHMDYFPDWRFGQFVSNFIQETGIDPFYIEEEEMLKRIKEYAERKVAEMRRMLG